jgi:hypothetical protein
VVSLSQPRGAAPRVALRDGTQLEADAVVLTVPAPEALRIADPLLTSADRDGLAGVRYAPGLTVAALLMRSLRARPQRVLVPRAERSPLACALIEPGLLAGRVAETRAAAARDPRSRPRTSTRLPGLARTCSARSGLARRAAQRQRATLREPHAAPRFESAAIGRLRAGSADNDARRRPPCTPGLPDHPSFEGAGVARAARRRWSRIWSGSAPAEPRHRGSAAPSPQFEAPT